MAEVDQSAGTKPGVAPVQCAMCLDVSTHACFRADCGWEWSRDHAGGLEAEIGELREWVASQREGSWGTRELNAFAWGAVFGAAVFAAILSVWL